MRLNQQDLGYQLLRWPFIRTYQDLTSKTSRMGFDSPLRCFFAEQLGCLVILPSLQLVSRGWNRICKVLLSRVNWGVKPGKIKKQRQNTGETKKNMKKLWCMPYFALIVEKKAWLIDLNTKVTHQMPNSTCSTCVHVLCADRIIL